MMRLCDVVIGAEGAQCALTGAREGIAAFFDWRKPGWQRG